MLSSYRNEKSARIRTGTAGIALLLAGTLVGKPGEAAQYYVQPTVEVSAESNTNITLDPVLDSRSAEGYLADVSLIIGAVTPRSETTMRPRIQYQEYPDYEDANRLQGGLDLYSFFRSARADFSVYAAYERRDEIDAELADAQFNELNPDAPTVPGTGRVRAGATRDLMLLSPTFDYALTQRFRLGVSALYQGLNYSPDDLTAIDYDYVQGNIYLKRAVTARVDVSVGTYMTRYETRDFDSQADAVGGALDIDMRWTETFTGNLRFSVEQNESDITVPVVVDDKVTAWGAEFNLARRGELSSLVLGVGRQITPGGSGGMYYTDQLQVEYNRDLSQRMSFVAAARFMSESPLSDDVGIVGRDYIRGDLGIEWMISPTWYVRAGYEYVWQEYELGPGSADNQKVVLGFGYKGMGPRR